jgi:AcrR family transcriptional regulator
LRPKTISDETILEIARAAFLTHGPAVSTAQIAADAGVSQATLFKRFGTKDELLSAALKPRAQDCVLDLMERGPDSRPVEQQLLEIATQVHTSFSAIMPCLSMLMAHDPEAFQAIGKSPQGPPARIHAAMTAWFARAQHAGLLHAERPEVCAHLFVGAVRSQVMSRRLFPHILSDLGEEDYLRAAVHTLLFGMAPGRKPGEPTGEHFV